MAPADRIAAWVPALAAVAVLAGSCSSEKVLYPPAGSVTLRVTDGALGRQTSSVPTFQAVRWVLDEATLEIEGFGDYPVLGVAPCHASANVLVESDLTSQCNGSPLALGAAGARGVGVRLAVSSMEMYRAWRPDLPEGGDYDGDGVENGTDNCPIVPNPDQEILTDAANGTACSAIDWYTGLYTDPDADADGIGDGYDNCIWLANGYQEDSNGDGIGDSCSRTTRVLLTAQPLRLDLPPVSLVVVASTISRIVVDFDDGKSLVDCDTGLTVCRLDPSAISVTTR